MLKIPALQRKTKSARVLDYIVTSRLPGATIRCGLKGAKNKIKYMKTKNFILNKEKKKFLLSISPTQSFKAILHGKGVLLLPPPPLSHPTSFQPPPNTALLPFIPRLPLICLLIPSPPVYSNKVIPSLKSSLAFLSPPDCPGLSISSPKVAGVLSRARKGFHPVSAFSQAKRPHILALTQLTRSPGDPHLSTYLPLAPLHTYR